MDENKIVFELSRDQALTLFDWLTREDEEEVVRQFKDKSEQYVLWVIEKQLEKLLHERFAKNYDELLARARDNVRNSPAGFGLD